MEENLEKLLNSLINVDYNADIKNPQNENILYLAYIGDTIFDLFTRDYILRNNISKVKIKDIHKMNSELVCAASQARIVEWLIDNNILDEEEIEFYNHARNAHSKTRSKNSSIIDYRKATGLEALIGLIYYKKDIDRLTTLFTKIKEYIVMQIGDAKS